ncbi:muconate cycloisomerase family protein [Planococcus liqunii]|uniref:Muconate cycloisomerase family protein n=1 Tax=Planococcus liqunii TaxID=3058394 RepID=A0ABT8MTY2_9BACL|nr:MULTISPECIES: muconate cycloisomerase family protein [unclassified Planococcus (in: firmicutes)]MDN7228367.1 muconate cycloisomerase family protein [Planococcus sp. N064]WKA50875.1 muconate cycloisomerase family protein [Planococcus sp. N056]
MKIRSFEVYILDLPTIRPHQLAMHTITVQTIVVGCVTDDEGREGWSEVATIGGASYGESTPEAIKANIDTYITPLIIGQDPNHFDRIMNDVAKLVRGNYFAKTVVENAIIDLAAKAKNIPAFELFGGQIHKSLPIAWTLASGNTEKDIEEAQEMLEKKRHNIFKLKIGKGDPFKNVEHVRSIKEVLGDAARLTVDVNQAWDEDTSNYCIAALEAAGVSMVEQPLAAWDFEGMSRLTAKFNVPIMADEAATSIQDVFRIAKYRAGNSIALKPCKHGGMTQTKKVVGIAEASGLGLYGGTMIESSLGTAACAQLYSTISDMKFGTEIFGPLLFKDNVTVNDIKFENFEVIVPDGPGFGMEIDKEKVKHYAREFSGKQEMMN